MCLSTVYKKQGEELVQVARQVSSVAVQGDTVSFTDIMGATDSLQGSIESVDLVANEIVVKVA